MRMLREAFRCSPNSFSIIVRLRKRARNVAIGDSETVHMCRRVTGWKAVYGMSDDDPDGYDAFLPIDLAVEDLGIAARAAQEASRVITPDHPQWNSIMGFTTRSRE